MTKLLKISFIAATLGLAACSKARNRPTRSRFTHKRIRASFKLNYRSLAQRERFN